MYAHFYLKYFIIYYFFDANYNTVKIPKTYIISHNSLMNKTYILITFKNM